MDDSGSALFIIIIFLNICKKIWNVEHPDNLVSSESWGLGLDEVDNR